MTKFRLTQLRTALFGIAEVEGKTGFWPLRRPVHFRIGVNCDEIRIAGGSLVVLKDHLQIAVAKYHPSAKRNGPATDLRWEALLQPRDRNRR